MSQRVIDDPELAGWELNPDTGYWMWKGEEGTGGLWEQNGDDIYYSDGNVGIGTDNPSGSLDIVRDGVQPLRIESTSGNKVRMRFANTGGSGIIENVDNNIVIPSGNVGIGTSGTNIPQRFCVEDTSATNISTYIQVKSGSEGNAGIAFGDSDEDLVGGVLFNNYDNALRFFKSGFTEAMRIDADGYTNITVPFTSSMRVMRKGATGDVQTSGIVFGNDFSTNGMGISASAETGFRFKSTTDTSSTGPLGNSISTDLMKIDADGRVDITGSLYVNGSEVGSGGGGLPDGDYTHNGKITATDFIATSDERLKDNITPMPVGLIDDIEPVSWEWKDGSGPSAGVVAQQLQSVGLGDYVNENEDGQLGVNYQALTAILLAEVIALKKAIK